MGVICLWEVAMGLTLGRFGDERLEKGGAIWRRGLSGMAARASAFCNWAATLSGRCGSRGSSTIVA
jgi:hypothetical protein